MNDQISITGLQVHACHGVLEHEKTQPQPFLADLVLDVDLSAASADDDLDRTVSYAEVAAEAEQVLTGESVELIETLAERIAAKILQRPAVERVAVTVRKPQAPAGVTFEQTASAGPAVTVRRARDVPVVIGLGANLGNPQHALSSAVAALRDLPGLRVIDVSDLVSTFPVGGPEQPDYLNAVLVGRTRLAPWTLLAALHRIEGWYGREREVRWGARTLDLDLIQYGRPGAEDELRSDRPDLLLPHPRAAERGFVLVPWLDADPRALVRVGDDVVTVQDRLEVIGDDGVTAGPRWRSA